MIHRYSVLVCALLCTSLAIPTVRAQQDAAVVQITTARQQFLTPETWVPGSVVSRFDSQIAAEVEGTLESVVEVGDRVHEGDPLGQINDESHQIQLRSDDARVRRLEANVRFLDRQLARFTELVASNSSAELEIDRVRLEQEMVVHELADAEAQRDQTRHRIERTCIRAPFDGVIAARMHQPGEFIRVGDPLVRLVDDARLEARVQAPVTAVRHVDAGTEVAIANEVSEDRAPIRAIVPVGDERSRMVELRIVLTPGAWVIGEPIRASIPSAPRMEAVTVPRDALVLRDSQVYVFRVDAEGKAERIRVVPGKGSADVISVKGPLRGGDRIVIRGAERLRHGALVKVLPGADEASSA